MKNQVQHAKAGSIATKQSQSTDSLVVYSTKKIFTVFSLNRKL